MCRACLPFTEFWGLLGQGSLRGAQSSRSRIVSTRIHLLVPNDRVLHSNNPILRISGHHVRISGAAGLQALAFFFRILGTDLF